MYLEYQIYLIIKIRAEGILVGKKMQNIHGGSKHTLKSVCGEGS